MQVDDKNFTLVAALRGVGKQVYDRNAGGRCSSGPCARRENCRDGHTGSPTGAGQPLIPRRLNGSGESARDV